MINKLYLVEIIVGNYLSPMLLKFLFLSKLFLLIKTIKRFLFQRLQLISHKIYFKCLLNKKVSSDCTEIGDWSFADDFIIQRFMVALKIKARGRKISQNSLL